MPHYAPRTILNPLLRKNPQNSRKHERKVRSQRNANEDYESSAPQQLHENNNNIIQYRQLLNVFLACLCMGMIIAIFIAITYEYPVSSPP